MHKPVDNVWTVATGTGEAMSVNGLRYRVYVTAKRAVERHEGRLYRRAFVKKPHDAAALADALRHELALRSGGERTSRVA